MICTLTARRVKPGAGDAYHQAFLDSQDDIPEEVASRWKRVYVCRDVDDPDLYLTFGLFDGSVQELRRIQGTSGRSTMLSRVEPHVAEVAFDGSFEVLEELQR